MPNEEDGKPDLGDPNIAVVFWIIDLDNPVHKDNNRWMWDIRERRKLSLIVYKTLDGIRKIVKTYITEEGKVH